MEALLYHKECKLFFIKKADNCDVAMYFNLNYFKHDCVTLFVNNILCIYFKCGILYACNEEKIVKTTGFCTVLAPKINI